MNAYRGGSKSGFVSVCLIALGLLTGLPASTAVAQVATATIQGEVTDETKGVLPGVTVTARNEQTGVSRFAVTDERGWYRITALQPGRYSMIAEVVGLLHRSSERRHVDHRAGVDAAVPTASGLGAGNGDGDLTRAPHRDLEDHAGHDVHRREAGRPAHGGSQLPDAGDHGDRCDARGRSGGHGVGGPQLGARRLSGGRRQPGEQSHARIARAASRRIRCRSSRSSPTCSAPSTAPRPDPSSTFSRGRAPTICRGGSASTPA